MATDGSDTTHDDATPKQAAIEALDRRADSVDEDREAFLRAHGWKHTSSFPDHCWRWCKVVDGQRITSDLRGAVRLEGYLP